MVVVLGAPNDASGELGPVASRRVQLAADLARRDDSVLLLPTGGFGEHFNVSSAPHWQHITRALVAAGVAPARVLAGVDSRNTAEDAELACAEVQRMAPRRTVVVTSEFHRERAALLFGRAAISLGLGPTLRMETTSAPVDEGTMAELVAHERGALRRLRAHPLLDELRKLSLPAEDCALFGSGPLLAHGWLRSAGDLDVLARGSAWERARGLGEVVHLDRWGVDVVNIGADITVGTEWAIGDVDVDALIDGADMVDGLPCAPLAMVEQYKRIADRPKDGEHLETMAVFAQLMT